MVLKFILLSSFCFNINNEIKCGQYLRDNLIDRQRCIDMANAIGRAQKTKMEGREGSLVQYEAHCIAINQEGCDVDHSFKISYTIS